MKSLQGVEYAWKCSVSEQRAAGRDEQGWIEYMNQEAQQAG